MNLDSNIELDARRFFLWWGRELAFLVPEKLRQWLSDRSGQIFLQATDDQLHFRLGVGGTFQSLATLPLNESTAVEYQRLKEVHVELEKAQCILRLNADQALGKILFLPAAAKENLEQVIAFELDRFMPFRADQVYYAGKPLGKAENGQLRLQLVVTPKTKLDNLIAELKALGIQPSVVEFADMPNDFEQDLETYNLLPEHHRPEVNPLARILTWSIGMAAFLLFIATLAFPVWYEGREVDLLKQRIKELEKDTRIVQARQLEIDEIVSKTERLLKTKNDMPSLTELINTVSKLMPDDTWLTHLQYNNERMQLQGQSPNASLLIGLLEGSSLFKNARFVSPLTQDRMTGMERFQISVEVKPAKENGEDE